MFPISHEEYVASSNLVFWALLTHSVIGYRPQACLFSELYWISRLLLIFLTLMDSKTMSHNCISPTALNSRFDLLVKLLPTITGMSSQPFITECVENTEDTEPSIQDQHLSRLRLRRSDTTAISGISWVLPGQFSNGAMYVPPGTIP